MEKDPAMRFEWNERKRSSNLAKHGLDFLDAWIVLENEHLVLPTYQGSDDARFMAIGLIERDYVALIYTQRGEAVRVISLRRARDGERQRHQAVFGR